MLDSAVRSGVLRVIIATTTLAVGVDFPVEVVILNGLKSGMTDLSPSEYKQMAGRAGRRSAGEVFVIESQDRFQFAISLMNATIPPVKSALTGDQRGIDRVLLEAITLGIVSTLDDMMRYLHVSMLSLNVSESELRRIVIESVGYLQEFQIIHGFSSPSGVLLRPSRLGRAISSSLLPIEESILIYRDLFLHQTHIMLHTHLFLVYFITPTFVVPYPRWNIFEKVSSPVLSLLPHAQLFQSLSSTDKEVAARLHIEESFISYCVQFPPAPFYPHPHSHPSSEQFRFITHCRFYGALLLRDIGMAGGDEAMLARIQAIYKVDRGELQRFWESSEMYLQLVTSMCEALNWTVLKRLLHSLRGWFKSRIPKSFACFLHEEDRVPFPCLQLLSEEELTVRDIAEMDEAMLARLLRIGMSGKFGMNPIDFAAEIANTHCGCVEAAGAGTKDRSGSESRVPGVGERVGDLDLGVSAGNGEGSDAECD